MTIPRPTGGYVDKMLAPGGWPDVDEAVLYDRARMFTDTLGELTDAMGAWKSQRGQVFEGGVWTGGAANAANGEVGANIDALTTLQNSTVNVITWHKQIAGMVERAKSSIIDNVEIANRQITIVENDTRLDAAEQEAAIKSVLTAAYGANVGIVTESAEQIQATKTWTAPGNALQDLLDRKAPPPFTINDMPAAPPSGTPRPGEPPVPGPTPPAEGPAPTPDSPPDPTPVTPPAPMPSPSPGTPPDGHSPQNPPHGTAPTGMPGMPGIPPAGITPQPGAGTPPPGGIRPLGSPGDTPGDPAELEPAGPDAETSEFDPAVPINPEAAAAIPSAVDGDRGKGVAPASVASPMLPSSPREDAAAVAPIVPGQGSTSTPGAMPGGAVPPAAAAGGGGGAGSRAPTRSKPLGPPPTPKPAAPSAPPAVRTGPPARPEPDRGEPPAVAALAAVPVSAARAVRDAVAAASTAQARRRDPLPLARRIAAALNAPNSLTRNDFGFFWVTAVTRDGDIVVANSYGLAYIPEGVYLPEPVRMIGADESIPATERARWATYPLAAVQGWAAHHDTALRAVIATEEQFAGSDPGAAKVVLAPDDIPESGEMAGRSRLEIVDPVAAEQLSDTGDAHLTALLPAAQATPEGTKDAGPPTDRHFTLWFNVIKPMMSNADGRAVPHLRAFNTYAAHAQEVAAVAAHEAVEPSAQRAAAADWLYWKHLTELLDAALTSPDA